ncbi:MAG: glycoside hydrolase family 9 protein [Planctomycetes bacterium]|nr:glycoside hydrolase family 9 protein [Planctomycetota bacterium]
MRATALVALTALSAAGTIAAQALDPHLRVDQFGYRPNARKVAVLREAVQGFDAPAPFTPGPIVEVRRVAGSAVVWSGAPQPWQNGAVQAESGDRVWWFDFSGLRTPGDYYVHEPLSGRSSAPFTIAPDVYDVALRAALRVFFYQRCGIAKAPPFADPRWADAASHIGPEQDTDCRSVQNPVPATSRDLRGGWYDAGDYNKYVNFADAAVGPLLDAYLDAPAYWPDDYGIPESGNGIPDLLDEIRWEVDWLLRMQNADGSLLHKVSVTSFAANSPPSTDTAPRRYAPATASATATGCHVFAHAAVAFGSRPEPALQAYAQQLDAAAAAGWAWLVANPAAIPSSYNNQGFVNVAAEDSPYEQDMSRLAAAAWRFVRGGDPAMRAWVDTHYTSSHLMQWGWASPWEAELHSALLAYTETAGATATVVAAIRQTFAASVTGSAHLARYENGDDAYMAHLYQADYTWGSNATKCLHAIQYLFAARYGLSAAKARSLHDAAEGFLHWLHGVNPLGLTFLTNMRAAGAEGSIDEIYHAWFADGTPWDNASTSAFGPAPGYLSGGPNPTFAPDPSYSGPPLVPPQGQPAQKSYRDWNANWPENSWEITEPAIGYQGRYVRLLAAYTIAPAPQLAFEMGEAVVGSATPVRVGGAEPNNLVALTLALGRGRYQLTLPFWEVDLGLSLQSNPGDNIFAFAFANSAGIATVATPTWPTAAGGVGLWFQATELMAGEPSQSAVIARTVR